jgi:hypothetical protein
MITGGLSIDPMAPYVVLIEPGVLGCTACQVTMILEGQRDERVGAIWDFLIDHDHEPAPDA